MDVVISGARSSRAPSLPGEDFMNGATQSWERREFGSFFHAFSSPACAGEDGAVISRAALTDKDLSKRSVRQEPRS